MNVADGLTASRLVMAPVFFVVYMWGASLGLPAGAAVAILWALFALIELSDLLDGWAARSMKTVSSFGKLFDPFADVFARLTYFVCFAFTGIMPLWIFLIIIYREFCQLFLRQLLAERGVAMGARKGGKTKAVFYMISGAASLFLWSLKSLGALSGAHEGIAVAVFALYCVSAALSVGSFVDYLVQFKKITAAGS
ncbi:MAG TPA: CDP-diacylglycerol--glycerol-3-phosphate 3-phosphatidyltransferase [Spirochaetia bacterium]|nr:CDP-diacylglycerol--glycerol-3-phosphate 3-phosphatidyltransferase [Spirochaetaceae bacterium]HRW24385.1 CDP-diacylglycerol--glycerol-3-phosphate 3-phosphatidyltransferase [Spirochaetia bacterium]